MNILVTAVLAVILLFSGLPMAQAGERYRPGITLFWSKGDVKVGLVGRYGSFGHGSHSFKSRRYIHAPRYKFPVHPRWYGHHKYFGQCGRFSHHKRFTPRKSFAYHPDFKHRGDQISHGSRSIHARPFTRHGRFGYQRNLHQSRSGGYGHSRGFLGVR